MKTYISVRTVKAASQCEAIDKVMGQEFDETNELCDRVLTVDELITELKKLK